MAMAACWLVPQPVTVIGAPSCAAVRMAVARSARAGCPAIRAAIRDASAGSAAIISVIRYGGPLRIGGMSEPAHGSGAPGSGENGSNVRGASTQPILRGERSFRSSRATIGVMDLRQTVIALAAAGTERNRAVAARHGAGSDQFGVSFKELRALARRIGPNQSLAHSLWATGNTDARLLACMVAEPDRMDEAELDAWLGEIKYYVLVDEFVSSVASRKPGVRARMERWTFAARDWVAQAGWDLAAVLALRDPTLVTDSSSTC